MLDWRAWLLWRAGDGRLALLRTVEKRFQMPALVCAGARMAEK
jgi:hypothetical protein